MRIIFSVVVAALFAAADASGQKNFVIGQQVPDVSLPANTPSGYVSMSDYRGKTLILDFWTTWCSSCIAKMPALHELQNEFGDSLQILLVNAGQKRAVVEKFVAKRANSERSRVTLPVVFLDSVRLKELKIGSFPTYFWIDRKGFFRFRGSSFDATRGNIVTFMQSGKFERYKEKLRMTFDSASARGRMVWKSELVKGKIAGFTSLKFSDEGGSSAQCIGCSVLDLYRFAFGTFHGGAIRSRAWIEGVPFNRTILLSESARDAGRSYRRNIHTDSIYSYRVTSRPFTEWKEISEVIKRELENRFGYSAQIEKVRVKYYSLTVPDTTVFKNVKAETRFAVTDTELHIENITIALMLQNHRSAMSGAEKFFLSDYPIVDESGYKGLIGGVHITDVDTTNPASLEAALMKTPIRLKLVEGDLEMLVIRLRDIQP